MEIWNKNTKLLLSMFIDVILSAEDVMLFNVLSK